MSVNSESGREPLLRADHLEAISVVKPGEVVAETDPAAKTLAAGQSADANSEKAKKDKQALWMSFFTLLISIPALIGA